MLNFDEIIKNEVVDCLGRNVDDDELKGFVDAIKEYIDTHDNKKIFLANIGCLIYDYRHDNYAQCEECGEWLRTGDDSEWNPDLGWVCTRCEPYQDPDALADFQNDLAREE